MRRAAAKVLSLTFNGRMEAIEACLIQLVSGHASPTYIACGWLQRVRGI